MQNFTSQKQSLNFLSRFNIEKFLIGFFIASTVLGYVVSVGKFYFFHGMVVVLLFSIVIGSIKLKVSSFSTMRYLFLFFSYAVFTILWTPDKTNALYYLFYFICALTVIFVIVNYSKDLDKLSYIFNVAAVFLLLNFFIGLLETTGKFRLPVSPYAIKEGGVYLGDNLRPSGFNSNLNNFGFVFLIVFPFLFFYPNRFVKVLSNVLLLWFAIRLQSKGFFLGAVLFYISLVVLQIHKKSAWRKALPVGFLSILLIVFFIAFSDRIISENSRIFSTFDEIQRGVGLISSGSVAEKTSTGVRSSIYLYGIKELIASYGVGLGIAGVGSKLAQNTTLFDSDSNIFSFHSFFLEMLVDFGVIPFFMMMFAYLKLIKNSFSVSKLTKSKKLSYFAKASAFSLVVAIPASISPSSIIYILTFWMVVGFSMSVFALYKRMGNC